MTTTAKRSYPTKLIAEIAQAHDGSLGIAHSFIDALAGSGIDIIKFQVHIADAESSDFEPFRVKFSREDATRYDYWKRMEFTEEQWREIKEHTEKAGFEFLASPFSNEAVKLLSRLGVNKFKIGSGEITNRLMLDRIAKTGKEIYLSSGMSSWAELEEAVKFLKPYGNKLTLFQCTTAYPTSPEQWGLEAMMEMKSRFGLPTGFSDHSGDIHAGLAAVSLGAEALEFHVTFSKSMFGPDAKASLSVEQAWQLADGVRKIERALQAAYTKENAAEDLKTMFGKSLAVNRDMKAGEVITLEDLESKKPKGKGIPAENFADVLNRKLKQDLPQWSFLNMNDLEK